MRRFTVFVVLILLLLAGGGLTSLLLASGGQVLPFLTQVNAPDADPTSMLPWKANQFFIFIGFILFNLVGIAVTIGILLVLIDWGLKQGKKASGGSAAATPTATTETAADES